MGREIRRVPTDWEHPKSQQPGGYAYTPLLDQTHEEALAKWEAEKKTFDRTDMTYEEWAGEKPDPAYYRPAWPEGTATAFQIYETVSEGTPTSPVFLTEDELVEWLVTDQGHSEEAARKFVEYGGVPSMMMIGGRIAMGIEALEPGFLPKEEP